MTDLPTLAITVADRSTRDICSIYLVGGFDEEKNHYKGRPEFRESQKQEYKDICHRAERGKILPQEGVKEERDERGDAAAWAQLQMAILGLLVRGFLNSGGYSTNAKSAPSIPKPLIS